MSLQWTIVATFLYAEMAVCILLMLPFISPTSWRKLFRSRLFKALTTYGNIYFLIFIAILIILFLDGVRDVYRYSKPLTVEDRNNPAAETNLHMKLFRSQRNFYIAGFALFLSLVMRRLVTLISRQGALLADLEATKKQAENASDTAKKYMDEQQNKQNKENEEGEENKKHLAVIQKELEAVKEDLKRSQKECEAIKHQAESTNREYDRLMKEHEKLQEELKKREVSVESKKDE